MSVAARVGLPTLAAALSATAVAVAVNVAMERMTDLWPWLVVALVTLVSAAVSLWLYRRSAGPARPSTLVDDPNMSGGVTAIQDNLFLGPTAVNGSGNQINYLGP